MTRCPQCVALAEKAHEAAKWTSPDHLYRRTVDLYHGRMADLEDCALMPHLEDPYRL